MLDTVYPFISAEISDCQSGFRKNDSPSLQLLHLVAVVRGSRPRVLYVGVIFFDLQKAFERVWHGGLLVKLEVMGVRGNALSWFHRYISGHSQGTEVAGVTSEFVDLHAGVPQGAIISPLLFTVFANDLPKHVSSSEVNLSADDTSASVQA